MQRSMSSSLVAARAAANAPRQGDVVTSMPEHHAVFAVITSALGAVLATPPR